MLVSLTQNWLGALYKGLKVRLQFATCHKCIKLKLQTGGAPSCKLEAHVVRSSDWLLSQSENQTRSPPQWHHLPGSCCIESEEKQGFLHDSPLQGQGHLLARIVKSFCEEISLLSWNQSGATGWRSVGAILFQTLAIIAALLVPTYFCRLMFPPQCLSPCCHPVIVLPVVFELRLPLIQKYFVCEIIEISNQPQCSHH